jgi:hypothetical protein
MESPHNGSLSGPLVSVALTAGERLSWPLKFARDELLTRGRWWVLLTASLFSSPNGRP